MMRGLLNEWVTQWNGRKDGGRSGLTVAECEREF